MVAHYVVHAKVKDAEKLAEYAKAAGATIAPHGGKFLVRAPILEMIGGNTDFNRLVLIEFPDAGKARNWYHSDAYQALIPVREQAADMMFTLIEMP